MKPNQGQVRHLFTEAILSLCKSCFQYGRELKVQGVLEINVDNSDVFVVAIDEAFAIHPSGVALNTCDFRHNGLSSNSGFSRLDQQHGSSILPTVQQVGTDAYRSVMQAPSRSFRDASGCLQSLVTPSGRDSHFFAVEPVVVSLAYRTPNNSLWSQSHVEGVTSVQHQVPSCQVDVVPSLSCISQPALAIRTTMVQPPPVTSHLGEGPSSLNQSSAHSDMPASYCTNGVVPESLAIASDSISNKKRRRTTHTHQLPSKKTTSNSDACKDKRQSDSSKVAGLVNKRFRSSDKKHLCTECGKAYLYPGQLAVHMRVHSGDRPYMCDVCNKTFAAPDKLNKHKVRHGQEKKHTCNACDKAFHHADALTRHMRTHLSIKPYKCMLCSKAFTQSNGLTSHMRTHTQTKPYKCTECGKEFRWSTARTMHISKAHAATQVTVKGKLYTCKICSKTTKYHHAMTYHMRSHTGERPFACTICGATFKQRCELPKHMRTHSTERLYLCSECGKVFKHPGNLKDHMVRHAGPVAADRRKRIRKRCTKKIQTIDLPDTDVSLAM